MRTKALLVAGRRCASTQAAAATAGKPRPYEEVPGPKPIPIIGNKFRFLPGFRKYDTSNLLTMHSQLRDEYGDIVRFSGLEPRRDLVFVYKPEDIESMYRNDGPWPERPSLNSLRYFRKHTRVDIFKGATGVLVDQGPSWQEARSHVNPVMMKTQVVHQYTPKIGQVAEDFVNMIPALRDEKNEMPEDFKNEIHKWALESIALVALDTRLGCLQKNLAPDSEPQQMINSVHTLLQCVQHLEIGNSTLWKFIPTPTWKKFVRTMDFFTEVSLKYINKATEKIQSREHLDENELSVLERFLKRDPNPVGSVVMALDMLMAGVDTTSHALTNLLLHLSAYQDKQEKLFRELQAILPDPSTPITYQMLDEMSYLKACIKETLRMQPVFTANARTTLTDVVLSGYLIPKGVDVIMGNGIISRLGKHYKDPEMFLPERWIRGSKERENVNPFVTLPFGHGARKCVGMRFALLELELAAAKMVRRFQWNYNYGEMTYRSFFAYVPVDPLKFQVTDRLN